MLALLHAAAHAAGTGLFLTLKLKIMTSMPAFRKAAIGGIRVIRGPHMEAWIIRSGKATPEITIKYGHRNDFTCQSFDQAKELAETISIAPKMLKLLEAIRDFNDGKRDDYEKITAQIDKLLDSRNNTSLTSKS